jgi:cell wall assembly regulator SMI1
VTAEVGRLWRRLERWLAGHAPATYASLAGPASAASIARAEAAMGIPFPGDLRASLLRHDGTRGVGGFGPPFYSLVSAGRAYQEWKARCDVLIQEEAYGWDGRLIPFAVVGDEGNMFVDSRTGSTGEFFQGDDDLWTTGDVVSPSYLELLRAIARSLETGEPVNGSVPLVIKGRLRWTAA